MHLSPKIFTQEFQPLAIFNITFHSNMPSDLTGDDYLSDYSHVSKETIDVQLLRLGLATAAVGFVLSI
ncbi:hypothetical protein N7447_005117 [Penicillium robsamsonii]|uniref:uncharacterized protein n=1 Tax=Penicillium robsamsonii TaxID=1792511 RepID=UPI002547AC56|nr:uncharacterized protein N7447_005117 [Penicillium robsamsonii]KAJ5822777.1 hypothetical protein N7447_005117 [Penicillium robsamsonii]